MIHWLSTLLTPCSDFWLRPSRNKWAWFLSVVMLAMSCAGEVSIDDLAPSKDLDKPNILWIIAEDLGLLGIVLLLSLFALLFHRLFTIMRKTNDIDKELI